MATWATGCQTCCADCKHLMAACLKDRPSLRCAHTHWIHMCDNLLADQQKHTRDPSMRNDDNHAVKAADKVLFNHQQQFTSTQGLQLKKPTRWRIPQTPWSVITCESHQQLCPLWSHHEAHALSIPRVSHHHTNNSRHVNAITARHETSVKHKTVCSLPLASHP